MGKKRFHVKKAKDNKAIAKERIGVLFEEAKGAFGENHTLSDRYVELARKISMKYNVGLTSEQKRMFCKRCHSFLVPSLNCRVRVRDGLIVYYCLSCKNFNRFRYK